MAVAVLAAGLVAASGAPAMAAPAAQAPAITIAAKSLFKPVKGDVFVMFLDGKRANALIHGMIKSAAKGDIARLFAQSFPFSAPAVQVGSRTLGSASAPYSFTVRPTLATRYQVELFTSTSTLITRSPVTTVYVSNRQTASATGRCPQTRKQPFCHQRIRVIEMVPASTLRDEISKHWYFYFALNLNQNRTPPTPRFARLYTRVTITSPVARGADQFTRTFNWSFYTGVNGYAFVWATCSKDTESTDGLGLPGHHACGVNVIDTTAEYVG
jgi:hypothetical protein